MEAVTLELVRSKLVTIAGLALIITPLPSVIELADWFPVSKMTAFPLPVAVMVALVGPVAVKPLVPKYIDADAAAFAVTFAGVVPATVGGDAS